ncbi:tetratricopeptide repeat protein [Prosthecobacter sp.]|uniref:tetratricopeptide repeat protein n=1 Tax=Prosthecobacter sp. TaxID=1965333 RepID=UPI002ABB4D96|nr:tetratricopeptide repeat protein [Prosthecobacter sp.]MDZ4405866.1 tetratricopeptide repeat protein [Prosthecobacter sp.]
MKFAVLRSLFAVLAVVTVFCPQASAQDDDLNIQTLFEKAGSLMEESNWEGALVPLERIMKEYGPSGYTDFGPAFGVMHYRYGFCLKNLKRLDDALKAYEACYTQGKNAKDTPKDKLNPVWELSLLEMGIIKQAQGKYAEAIKDYEAFARQPAPAGTYDDGAFRVQVASCYSKAGMPDKAKALLDQLISGAGGVTPKAEGVFRAFLSLLDSWTAKDAANHAETEKAAHAFMDANGVKLKLSPFDMARFDFNARLLGVARAASDNDQQTLAIRLLGLMASSSDILFDLQERALRYRGRVPDLLKKEIEKYTELVQADDSIDWIALLTLAGCYERLGNFPAGYAIYTYGVTSVPKSPHRPMMLFGSMRTALATEQQDLSKALGEQFRKEFPQHEFAGNVNTLLLENVFFSKQYDQAIELAGNIRKPLAPDSKDRDLTDFVIGASLFNLGRTEEAQKELASHAERFPQSKFKEAARYFEASSLVRLKKWAEAGPKLDAFNKDFPESEYIGFALLDRATVHFQLGEYQKCLDTVADLEKRRPSLPDLDRALAMRGDSHLMLNANDKAEAAYLKARELGEAAQGDSHKAIVGRVLVQLVRVANALNKPKDVIKYYDDYITKYSGGFYDAEVIVGSMEPLKEVKRGKEALDALEKVIVRLGSGDTGTGIEEAIGSYTQNYLDIVGPEQLLERLTNFVPKDGARINNTLRAWLNMARIDLLENDSYKDKFPKRAAQIQVAYEELQKFDKSELASYILVKVGRDMVDRGKDKEALEWFKAVMDRGQSEHYPLALMGKARVLAKAGEAGSFQEAVAAFDQVIRELKDKPEYVEEAMIDKSRIYYNRKQWQQAADTLVAMTKDTRFTRTRAEVFYRLGQCYENLNDTDKALEAYTPFVGPPLENVVQYSAEARLRAAEIQMKKGNDDKAFRLIKDTVSRMYKLTSHEVAGPFVIKAKEYYKTLRKKLNVPEHPDEGLWGVRE